MGLFDKLFSDDPKDAAFNAMAFGLLGGKGNFNQVASGALMSGQEAMMSAKKAQQQSKLSDMQMEQMRRKAEQEAKALQQEELDAALLRQQYTPLAGPTENGSPLMPRFDPASMLERGASVAGVGSAAQMNALMNPQRKRLFQTVGDSLVEIPEQGDPRSVFATPPKPEKAPSSVQEYEFAREQGYKGTFEQWGLASKRAGAPSVSVNTGQKGLDNTLKLRGDFRSEPIYKAHAEVQSAHSQITAGLKLQSPAGDLAGATKLMKILDPTSVVRESELGMAMAASGLLDRVQNYATKIITGQKLTPTQRADFQNLANKMTEESAKFYNAKRSEYEGIANRNKIDVRDVLGDPLDTGNKPGIINFSDLKN